MSVFIPLTYVTFDSPWPHFLRILWSRYKFSKSELNQYTETFRTIEKLLEHFMEWLLLQINILLLKLGIRKHIAASAQ